MRSITIKKKTIIKNETIINTNTVNIALFVVEGIVIVRQPLYLRVESDVFRVINTGATVA